MFLLGYLSLNTKSQSPALIMSHRSKYALLRYVHSTALSKRLSRLQKQLSGGDIFTLKYVQGDLHAQKAHNMYN